MAAAALLTNRPVGSVAVVTIRTAAGPVGYLAACWPLVNPNGGDAHGAGAPPRGCKRNAEINSTLKSDISFI